MSKDHKPTNRKRDSVYDEKRTPLDGMKEQQHTDDIPMEDLKIDELKIVTELATRKRHSQRENGKKKIIKT